jgi:hypothetical protein
MVALLIENSKLIMIFLLIGTIIGLAYFGSALPTRNARVMPGS